MALLALLGQSANLNFLAVFLIISSVCAASRKAQVTARNRCKFRSTCAYRSRSGRGVELGASAGSTR